MINEERVKQLYKVALYEKNEEKKHRGAGQYYRSDYVGKEIIKSIFTGTIAYVLFAMLWAMTSWKAVLESINNLEIINTIAQMIVIYIGFMALYLFATFLVYIMRYGESKKKLTDHKENLKKLHQMYEREDKLKM